MNIYALFKMPVYTGNPPYEEPADYLKWYYTSGQSEVCTFEGNDVQFVTGLQIDNLEFTSTVGRFEDIEQTFGITETDGVKYWQNVAATKNLIGMEVYFMQKMNGLLDISNAMFRGVVQGYGVTNGIWNFTIKSKYSNFDRVEPLTITVEEYPNAPATSIGQPIALGVGLVSASMIPPSIENGYGVVNCYKIGENANLGNYLVAQTVGSLFNEETVQEVYRDGLVVPISSQSASLTGDGFKRLYVSFGQAQTNPVQAYVKMTTRETNILTNFIRLLWMMGYTELQLDGYTNPNLPGYLANTEFNRLMVQRGFQNNIELSVAFATQNALSFNEMSKIFSDCFGCQLRMGSNGCIEAKIIDIGNVSNQVNFSLVPSDLINAFQYAQVTTDEIENKITGGYAYQAHSGKSTFTDETFDGNSKLNVASFFEHPNEINLRWAYTEAIAFAMKKYYYMLNSIPKNEIKIDVIEERIPTQTQAGDIFTLSDANDISAGKETRYYQVKRMSRRPSQGIVEIIAIDITDLEKYDYSTSVAIQADDYEGSKLHNYSVKNADGLQVLNVVQLQDDLVPGGKCWQSTGTGSDIIVENQKRLTDWKANDNIQISFMAKLTSTSTTQTFYQAKHATNGKNSYFQIRYIGNKLQWIYRDSDLGVLMDDIQSTVTWNDSQWHHILFWAEKQANGNITFRMYIDGVRVSKSTRTMPDTFDTLSIIGTYMDSIGFKSERFTGRMAEFQINTANVWNATDTTCTVQTKQNTFFGPNGATQFDKHFYV